MGCFKELSIAEDAAALPYAYYKCDEPAGSLVAVDSIAGFDLVTVNPIVKWPTAKIGTAFFDPLLNLQDSIASTHWDFAATGFTVRLWFELNTVPVSNAFFILNVNSSPSNITQWDLTLQSSLVPSFRQFPRFRIVLNGISSFVDGPDLTDTTAFHRLMCGWEKGVGVWIKFDNDATISVANTDPSLNGGNLTKFFLGPTNEPQAMGIDEVGIWNRTLTAAEILADWNGGAGVTYP
jgi:hypothetical protein